MATEVTTRLRDDIDGSVADRTVSFTWDGAQYDIDLSKKNAAELEAVLAPYVAAGRRSGGRTTSARGRKTSARPAKAAGRPRASASGGSATDLSAVRTWAAANGLVVAARGRISAAVLDAFRSRSVSSNGTGASVPAAKAPAKRAATKAAAKTTSRKRPAKKVATKRATRSGRPSAAAESA
jgi:hypothetical protein